MSSTICASLGKSMGDSNERKPTNGKTNANAPERPVTVKVISTASTSSSPAFSFVCATATTAYRSDGTTRSAIASGVKYSGLDNSQAVDRGDRARHLVDRRLSRRYRIARLRHLHRERARTSRDREDDFVDVAHLSGEINVLPFRH